MSRRAIDVHEDGTGGGPVGGRRHEQQGQEHPRRNHGDNLGLSSDRA